MADGWRRTPCPHCARRATYYCPHCFVPVGVPEGAAVPSLALPVKVDIVFRDSATKSTAPHARVLAPGHVALRRFPEGVPCYGGGPPADVIAPLPPGPFKEDRARTVAHRKKMRAQQLACAQQLARAQHSARAQHFAPRAVIGQRGVVV